MSRQLYVSWIRLGVAFHCSIYEEPTIGKKVVKRVRKIIGIASARPKKTANYPGYLELELTTTHQRSAQGIAEVLDSLQNVMNADTTTYISPAEVHWGDIGKTSREHWIQAGV